MNRRRFLQTMAASGCAVYAARGRADEPPAGEDERLTLGAPLTHSDWALKANIPWGAEGVRHMLDACKACGWSRVHWRALDGGRALYKGGLLGPQGEGDEDSFWDPQTDEGRELAQRFPAGPEPGGGAGGVG